jgi:hypothetical protein
MSASADEATRTGGWGVCLDINSVPELVEFTMVVSKSNESLEEGNVNVDLRVGPALVEGPDDLTISVSVKRLILSLDLAGLKIAPGSRFGELLKPNTEIQERSVTSETTVEGELKGGLGVKLDATIVPQVDFSTGGRRTAKTTSSTSSTERLTHTRVRARGNQTWDVTEPPWEETKYLDATYLNNDLLCKVHLQKGANTRIVQLTAFAKQKELIISTKSKSAFGFRSTNHERLMKVLIGKALSASGGKYNGIVTFSSSEVEFED